MMKLYKRRTLIELDEEYIQQLDDLKGIRNLSRNHLIKMAVENFLLDNGRLNRRAAFGAWKSYPHLQLKAGE